MLLQTWLMREPRCWNEKAKHAGSKTRSKRSRLVSSPISESLRNEHEMPSRYNLKLARFQDSRWWPNFCSFCIVPCLHWTRRTFAGICTFFVHLSFVPHFHRRDLMPWRIGCSSSRRRKKKPDNDPNKLWCISRRPEDDKFMIQCDEYRVATWWMRVVSVICKGSDTSEIAYEISCLISDF